MREIVSRMVCGWRNVVGAAAWDSSAVLWAGRECAYIS